MILYPENYPVNPVNPVKKRRIIFDMIDRLILRNTLKTLIKSLMQNLLIGKVRADVEKINKLLEEEA